MNKLIDYLQKYHGAYLVILVAMFLVLWLPQGLVSFDTNLRRLTKPKSRVSDLEKRHVRSIEEIRKDLMAQGLIQESNE